MFSVAAEPVSLSAAIMVKPGSRPLFAQVKVMALHGHSSASELYISCSHLCEIGPRELKIIETDATQASTHKKKSLHAQVKVMNLALQGHVPASNAL